MGRKEPGGELLGGYFGGSGGFMVPQIAIGIKERYWFPKKIRHKKGF